MLTFNCFLIFPKIPVSQMFFSWQSTVLLISLKNPDCQFFFSHKNPRHPTIFLASKFPTDKCLLISLKIPYSHRFFLFPAANNCFSLKFSHSQVFFFSKKKSRPSHDFVPKNSHHPIVFSQNIPDSQLYFSPKNSR